MKQARKIYDAAFKIKDVELSNERSNISGLARELGIRFSMLYKWRKDFERYCPKNVCKEFFVIL